MRSKRVNLIMTVLLFILCIPISASAAENIQLDGSFNDWSNQLSVTDGSNDGPDGTDFKTLSWGTNQNEQALYFMIERYSPKNASTPMVCRLFFDINNNGSYEDQVDKFAEIHYDPASQVNNVTVKLFSSSGKLLSIHQGQWGEDASMGGKRLEFSLTNKELEIFPPQSIRFYLSGIGGASDRLPGRGDIKWEPFPGHGVDKMWIGAAIIVWLAVTAFFFRHRIWLFYFIFGAVGFTFFLLVAVRGSAFELVLEHVTGLLLQSIFKWFNIFSLAYDNAPGTLLVLNRMDNTWTTIGLDIESSGFLELSIFLGLVLFYPSYTPKMKLKYSLLGIAFNYLSNLVRLITIISIIQIGGRDSVYFAYSVLGRLVYFVLSIAIYWTVFTKPTLKRIREQVENA